MAGYQYQHGDRPLDGYTIQHAAGRGGFGEVYYALSDSGRQVALKAVQGYEQIELRGISQCMNLKSPHLVTIFDVKHNDQGRPFVIMEYVSGPSLRRILDESPGGIGEQKTAFFLREIAKGLTYLHDCGIVHRDLKPGNIFYEDGYVKIGDYGLSKAMTASMHSGQTITVGTVHYMAPEIGQGKYDRSIDIYALGIMLYEMLTGTVPYFGASPTEILMKHLSAEPDLSSINEPFKTVIRRALAKDPAERFKTVQEMVEAVFGAEHVRQSVSQFSPQSLSMVAGKIAAPAPPSADDSNQVVFEQRTGDTYMRIERKPDGGQRIHQKAGDWERTLDTGGRGHWQHGKDHHGRRAGSPGAETGLRLADLADAAHDPIRRGQRHTLVMLTALTFAVAAAALVTPQSGGQFSIGALVMLMTCGAVAGIEWVRRRFSGDIDGEPMFVERLKFGGAGAIAAMLAALPVLLMLSPGAQPWIISRTIGAIAAPLLIVNWAGATAAWRRKRLSLGQTLGIALLGMLAAWFFDGYVVPVVAVLAATSLATQIIAPWDPTVRQRLEATLRQRRGAGDGDDAGAERQHGDAAADFPGADTARHAPPDYRGFGTVRRAQLASQWSNVSTRKRLWAMLLAFAWFFGFSGLHRFYAGKIFTGLLWFFTGGLLGIGQFIDVILIVTGGFKDSDGRTLLVWESFDELKHLTPPPATVASAPPPAPAQAPASAPLAAGQYIAVAGSRLLALVNAALLLLAIVIGTAVALNVPAMIDAGLPDPAFRSSIVSALGDYPNWPGTLRQGGMLVTISVLGLATLLFMVNRRRGGFVHCTRAIVAVAGVALAMFVFQTGVGFIDWSFVALMWQGGSVGRSLDAVLHNIHQGPVMLAACLMIASLTLLVWPPRPHTERTSRADRQGV